VLYQHNSLLPSRHLKFYSIKIMKFATLWHCVWPQTGEARKREGERGSEQQQ